MTTLPKARTIGEAEYVGNFRHDSPEWHAARAEVMGSSDVAAILGLSPFKSAFTLWHEKAGLILPAEPDENQRLKYEYGHHMEPFIARQFARKHPDLAVMETGSWRNIHRPWQGCNPDRLIAFDTASVGESMDAHALAELKTAPSETDYADGPPPGYRVQLLWQLDTFGFKRGWIAVWFNIGGRYGEWEFEVDPFEMDAIRAQVLGFANSITDGNPPEIDGSSGTYETIRRLNPSLTPKEERLIPAEIAEQYLEARAANKAAESDLNKWKGHLLAHMGTAQYALYDGRKIASRVAVKDSVPYLKEA